MARIALLALALALVIAAPAAARTVEGVDLPESTEARDGTALKLHGAGVRTKFFFDIYVGTLYLPETGQSLDAILGQDRAARIEMHFLYDEVSQEQLAEAWRSGFAANNADDVQAAVAERLERFVALFPTATEGDEFAMEYVPGAGTRVSVNGDVRGTIEGRTFFRALLGVFLGPEPADSDMKAGMLGGG